MAGDCSPATICKLSSVSVFHPTGTRGASGSGKETEVGLEVLLLA